MKTHNKARAILALLFALSGLTTASTCLADASEIYMRNQNAVVFIRTYNYAGDPIAQGSGFVVKPNGYVVTNYHVISDAHIIEARIGRRTLSTSGAVLINKQHDVALIKFDADRLETVTIGTANGAIVGQEVIVIGNPEGLKNSVSEGILSGIRDFGSGGMLLQISAPISSGSSGGPVFNSRGEVIGVATSSLTDGQNLNFAVPIDLIKKALRRGNAPPKGGYRKEKYGSTAEYWVNKGYIYDKKGQYQDAVDAYKKAIRIDATHLLAHHNLAVSYKDLGYYDLAIEEYNAIVRIDPRYEEAYFGMGIVYGRMGLLWDEVRMYEKTVEINPNHQGAHIGLSAAYGDLGMDESSLRAAQNAVELNPQNAMAQFNLGLSHAQMGDKKAALHRYYVLLKIDPKRAEKLLAEIYR